MIHLPDEILRHIVGVLSLSDASNLLQVNRKLSHLLDGFVMPHRPSMKIQACSGIIKLEDEKLCRISSPGHGVITGSERVDEVNCYWAVELLQFQGFRIEIGVCNSKGITKNGNIDRHNIWTFDCAGRIRNGDEMKEYGEKLSTGVSVGILYCRESNSLTFFRDGICMGRAFTNLKCRTSVGSGLYPIVIIPSMPGERVAVHGAFKYNLPTTTSVLMATQYKWQLPAVPKVYSLTIESFSPAFNFQLEFPGYSTTIHQLKCIIAQCDQLREFYIEPTNIMLWCNGEVVANDKTLGGVGIKFGENGAQLQDLILYL